MKHKPDSWNDATLSNEAASSVRRSLTRAGLQLGQLSHAVSGALSTLQNGANPRGAAQNRMRALLNQDRALLSHRACGQASLVDEMEAAAPEIPVQGSQTRGAAQNRMRELLNQDRALLALREARKLEQGESAAHSDDDDLELKPQLISATSTVPSSSTTVASTAVEASVSRATCVGATTSFAAPEIAAVCTPGPVSANETVRFVEPRAEINSVQPVKVVAAPVVIAEAPKPVAPALSPRPASPAPAEASSGESAADPIRTRGMAKLLALQGYKDRALSIYDELIAAEPNNAELRAEADRLRN